jgi:hypothetical protein
VVEINGLARFDNGRRYALNWQAASPIIQICASQIRMGSFNSPRKKFRIKIT